MSDEYTGTPTVIRVYEEHGEWFVDGLDARTGDYTDACWRFDTRAQALAETAEFISYAAHYLFTWEWPTDRAFRVGDAVVLTEEALPGRVIGITDEGLFLVDVESKGVYVTLSEDFLTAYDPQRFTVKGA